jgi:D-glycero-alpha-D-manno-heptose-7-phosphate kinase
MATGNDRIKVFAPGRIAFAGGGTDLPAYAERYGGAVFSAAVTLGARVEVSSLDIRLVSLLLDDFGLRADYAGIDELLADPRPEVALVGRTVAEVRPAGGVLVRVRTGLPPGSGLGISGAVGVSVVYALNRIAGRNPTPEEVAEAAAVIEIEKMGRPVGRQDQYAAACGGLNLFQFDGDGAHRTPVNLPAAKLRNFESHFMLFFSGRRRDSAEVLADQRARVLAGDRVTIERLHRLRALAHEMGEAAAEGDWFDFGQSLRGAWLAKRGVSPNVADGRVAAVCARVLDFGAWAMKVTGAGAGGFYLVMALPSARGAVTSYLRSEGFEPYDFGFDAGGVRIVP